MSGKNGNGHEQPQQDARSERTRCALLTSLRGLVAERRYDEFDVRDIFGQAEVGRSTFYDHYRGKDDMILATMSGMLDTMAGVAAEHQDMAQLDWVLRHFLENKKFALHCFSPSSGLALAPRVTRELAKRIEAHLRSRQSTRGAEPSLPNAWIASQIAEAQFALVRAWLADDVACDSLTLAQGMRASAQGTLSALVE